MNGISKKAHFIAYNPQNCLSRQYFQKLSRKDGKCELTMQSLYQNISERPGNSTDRLAENRWDQTGLFMKIIAPEW